MPIESMTGSTANMMNAQQALGAVGAQKKADIIGGATQLAGGLGDAFAQKQMRDALAAEGLDPNIAQGGPLVATHAILDERKRKLQEKQDREQADLLRSAFADDGSAPAPSGLPAPPEGPPGSELLRAQPTSGMPPVNAQGGVPVPMAKPTTFDLGPTGPAPAAPADPRAAAFRRLMKTPGMGLDTLGHGMKAVDYLYPEAKPVDPSEVELRRAQAAKALADANAPPPARNIDPLSPEGIAATEEREKRIRAGQPTDPRRRVLTPEHAKKMGFPDEWADGETTVGEAEDAAQRQGIGKPTAGPKGDDQPIPPEIAAAAEKRYNLAAGSLTGKTYRDAKLIGGDPLTQALNELRVEREKTAQAEHQPPSEGERLYNAMSIEDKAEFDRLKAAAAERKGLTGSPRPADPAAVAAFNDYVAKMRAKYPVAQKTATPPASPAAPEPTLTPAQQKAKAAGWTRNADGTWSPPAGQPPK